MSVVRADVEHGTRRQLAEQPLDAHAFVRMVARVVRTAGRVARPRRGAALPRLRRFQRTGEMPQNAACHEFGALGIRSRLWIRLAAVLDDRFLSPEEGRDGGER